MIAFCIPKQCQFVRSNKECTYTSLRLVLGQKNNYVFRKMDAAGCQILVFRGGKHSYELNVLCIKTRTFNFCIPTLLMQGKKLTKSLLMYRNNVGVNDPRSYQRCLWRVKGLKNSGLKKTRALTSAMPVQCSSIYICIYIYTRQIGVTTLLIEYASLMTYF